MKADDPSKRHLLISLTVNYTVVKLTVNDPSGHLLDFSDFGQCSMVSCRWTCKCIPFQVRMSTKGQFGSNRIGSIVSL